jgi:hypothetical protein
MTTIQPKRRFLRFSLRTLLVSVVVLSVPLGWFAMQIERARRQREAVRAIVEVGGTVTYTLRADEPELWAGCEKEPIPTWLPGRVCEVTVHGRDFRDNDMERLVAHLVNLPNLRVLCVNRTQITDDGLKHLAVLNTLEKLNLNDTKITDEQLMCLSQLTDLEVLSIGGTQVTEEGIERLQQALPNCDIGAHRPKLIIH